MFDNVTTGVMKVCCKARNELVGGRIIVSDIDCNDYPGAGLPVNGRVLIGDHGTTGKGEERGSARGDI